MTGFRVDVYQDRRKQWRWRVRAGNGKVVADCAEGYVRVRDCVRMASQLFPGFPLHRL